MQRPLKILIHLFFWTIYLVFAGVMSFGLKDGVTYLVAHSNIFILNWIWALLAFYVMYRFGYRFFERKRYVYYIVWTSAFSLLLTLIFYILYSTILYNNILEDGIQNFYASLPGTFIIANCGSLIRGFENWSEAVKRKEELEVSNLKHELASLKAQINPHFLFNTLNNIDSLIHTNPVAASDCLVSLSAIMRYILYGSSTSVVDISQEATHIENVIALQSMRHVHDRPVLFVKSISNPTSQIAPLLFTPFLENAFKFASFENDQKIHISLECHNDHLEFSCQNAIDISKSNSNHPCGGIGLANVKRRLQLLYPGRHMLELKTELNTFSVLLNIQLEPK